MIRDDRSWLYDSPSDVARATVVLLAAGACVDGVGIAAAFSEIAVLRRSAAGEDVEALLARSDTRRLVIDIARAVFGIPTIVFFLIWNYRVYQNLQSFCSRPRALPVWWAVVAWFVPLLNLWRPFQIVKEIWWVSSSPERAERAPAGHNSWGPPWLYAWWILLVAGTLLERKSHVGTARSIPGLISQVQMATLADALFILAALFAIQVVRRISADQDRAARHTGQRGLTPV